MEFIKNEQVGQHLHVTVRDTDINKLNDHGVAQLVQDHGRTILPGASLSLSGAAYPVDENGETSPELVMGKAGRAAAFQRDFRLTAR